MEASKTSAAVSFLAAFYQLPDPSHLSNPHLDSEEKQAGTQGDTWADKDGVNWAERQAVAPHDEGYSQIHYSHIRATARCSSSYPLPPLAWAQPLQTPAACLPLCSFLSHGCCCFDAYSCCRRRRHLWFASFEQLFYLWLTICLFSFTFFAVYNLIHVCFVCACVCPRLVIQSLII